MAQRAVVFRAPYGAKLVQMQVAGTIEFWLYYDNELPQTTDQKVYEWMRDTAQNHKAMLDAQPVIHPAQNAQSLAVKPEQMKSVAPPVVVPELTRNENRQHDWGGPYRLALTCKNCGIKSTGFEGAKCEPTPKKDHNDPKPVPAVIPVISAPTQNLLKKPCLHCNSTRVVDGSPCPLCSST